MLNNQENYTALFTVKETASILRTNPAFVYRLIRAKELPVLKLGSYKVRKETLEKFLVEHEGMDLTDPQNIKEIA